MWKQAYNVDRNLAKYLEVYECGRRSRRTRSGVTPRQDCDWANISFQLRATARFWHARYIRTRTVVGRPIQCGRQSMSASIQSGIVETTKKGAAKKVERGCVNAGNASTEIFEPWRKVLFSACVRIPAWRHVCREKRAALDDALESYLSEENSWFSLLVYRKLKEDKTYVFLNPS